MAKEFQGQEIPEIYWDIATPEQRKQMVDSGLVPPSKTTKAPGIGDVVGSAAKDVAKGAVQDKIVSMATPSAPATPSMPVALGPGGDPVTGLGAELPGFFDTGGLLGDTPMTMGQYVPGVAGAIGIADILANQRHGGRGALQGAASGAGIGFTVGGPVGAAIGAPIGAGIGYFGNLGDEDKWKTEQDRANKLRDKGINWDIPSENLTKGRSKEELIALEQAKIDAGKYGNTTFAQSRNEADLKPEDIWGSAAFGEKYGDKWLKEFSEQQRRDISQELLNAGAVNEHHGTMDFDFSKIDAAKLAELEKIKPQGGNGEKPVSTPQATPRRESPRGAAPSLADVLPSPISPPIQPEPDDEPDAAEKQRVSNYQTMLENMLKMTRGGANARS